MLVVVPIVRLCISLLACLCMTQMAMGRGNSADAAQHVGVLLLSSRPDVVSGGDTLVQVNSKPGATWSLRLNGRDVTREFVPDNDSEKQIGLLTGLKLGENVLELRDSERNHSKLKLLNHARTGPIFSGTHDGPLICETEASGLGRALDKDCTAKTIVKYYYRSTETENVRPLDMVHMGAALGPFTSGFKPYDPSKGRPDDVAQTITSEGRSVPYIVRREIGVINRAIYDIQFLHQPGEALPTPWQTQIPGWNGRLVYLFGAGRPYHQGRLGAAGMDQEPFIAAGYAVAIAFPAALNDRVYAETVSMVKEHFIETYGQPVHVIGFGGSFGAIQQHLMAQNYPGLLDGIIAVASYPDFITTFEAAADCPLLDHAFKTVNQHWTEQQKTAVSGFATWRTCTAWSAKEWLLPQSCDAEVPKGLVYDRISNPNGLRCDIYSAEATVFGRDPRTGLANRPLDNVGVQYGLLAFTRGEIDAEQFVELNERMGGYDQDGDLVESRTAADAEAVRMAYQRGLVVTGGGGLSETPIIDVRWYADDLADNHDSFRSFALRSRLMAANGSAENQVILTYPRTELLSYLNPHVAQATQANWSEQRADWVRKMSHWLENIADDNRVGTRLVKIARSKPANLADGCVTTQGEEVVELASYEDGRCRKEYPTHADPRIAAGAPLTGSILKCALKPIKPADYTRPLSDSQIERLKATFPTGVCDYSRPGEGQPDSATVIPWRRFNH